MSDANKGSNHYSAKKDRKIEALEDQVAVKDQQIADIAAQFEALQAQVNEHLKTPNKERKAIRIFKRTLPPEASNNEVKKERNNAYAQKRRDIKKVQDSLNFKWAGITAVTQVLAWYSENRHRAYEELFKVAKVHNPKATSGSMPSFIRSVASQAEYKVKNDETISVAQYESVKRTLTKLNWTQPRWNKLVELATA